MFKGMLRSLLLACLLLQPTSTLHAVADHFWLLQEFGIEKRALADGSLMQNFAPAYKPLAFSVKPSQQGIWAVADGYLISFDANGDILKSTLLENVNQNAYLVTIQKGGVWLVHGNKRFEYNDAGELVATLDLPTNGNRITDVAFDNKNKRMWLTTANTVFNIDEASAVTPFELNSNEQINGIIAAKSGDIALIVATPQPEFRLYSPTF